MSMKTILEISEAIAPRCSYKFLKIHRKTPVPESPVPDFLMWVSYVGPASVWFLAAVAGVYF